MDPENEMKTCKVVLLGESGVGKTSIISRYVQETVDDFVLSTVGSSYVSKTMQFQEYDNQSLQFEIWDTAGQERFRALTRMFYKDAAIAILVYAVPNPLSFVELKKYWYNQIHDYASKNIIISIVGNKSDLSSEQEEVDEAEARVFAKEIGAYFRLTSAKNGQGIDDLFKSVGAKFINPDYHEESVILKKKRSSVSIKQVPVITGSNSATKKKKCC